MRRATPLGSVEATETCCSASIAPLCLSMALKPSESCGAKRYSERVCAPVDARQSRDPGVLVSGAMATPRAA